MPSDLERLEILAYWHIEQSRSISNKRRRSSQAAEAARQLAAHHDDAAVFLGRLALDMRAAAQEAA